MAWYSHLFKNFPQFVVIHKVKGSDIVNKAEIDILLEPSCFFVITTFKDGKGTPKRRVTAQLQLEKELIFKVPWFAWMCLEH